MRTDRAVLSRTSVLAAKTQLAVPPCFSSYMRLDVSCKLNQYTLHPGLSCVKPFHRWAPWSEEFGRKPVLQYSLLMVNLCCIPVALANIHRSFVGILLGRAFGGLFSAGGSVTLGVVADMFTADEQELPLAYIVLSSVGGSIIGPIIGGFIEQNLYWTWTIWIQLIFGLFVQILHLAFVPETRSAILVNRYAKKMREAKLEATGENSNVFGPFELKPFTDYLVPKEVFAIWTRPFQMLYKEKIVLVLSLLSGFSDALIFMQIQSLRRVFQQWNFTNIQIGLVGHINSHVKSWYAC